MARHELYQATTSLYNRLIFTRSAAISRNAMMAALLPVVPPAGQTQIPFTAPLSPETLPAKRRCSVVSGPASGLYLKGSKHHPSCDPNDSIAEREFPNDGVHNFCEPSRQSQLV